MHNSSSLDLQTRKAHCPYCSALTSWVIDPSAGEQEYIEDCEVCCRPIQCRVYFDSSGDATLSLYREDE